MSCWVRSWSNGTCVGRTLLSAAFEFCFFFAVTPKVLGPIRGQPKSKSGSKAADRACPELVEGSVTPHKLQVTLTVTLVISTSSLQRRTIRAGPVLHEADRLR